LPSTVVVNVVYSGTLVVFDGRGDDGSRVGNETGSPPGGRVNVGSAVTVEFVVLEPVVVSVDDVVVLPDEMRVERVLYDRHLRCIGVARYTCCSSVGSGC